MSLQPLVCWHFRASKFLLCCKEKQNPRQKNRVLDCARELWTFCCLILELPHTVSTTISLSSEGSAFLLRRVSQNLTTLLSPAAGRPHEHWWPREASSVGSYISFVLHLPFIVNHPVGGFYAGTARVVDTVTGGLKSGHAIGAPHPQHEPPHPQGVGDSPTRGRTATVQHPFPDTL